MTKTLTEAQAWRALAEALAVSGAKLAMGLCYMLDGYTHEYTKFGVADKNRDAMSSRLAGHYWMRDSAAWIGPLGDAASRVIFCLFMALEAEDDAND